MSELGMAVLRGIIPSPKPAKSTLPHVALTVPDDVQRYSTIPGTFPSIFLAYASIESPYSSIIDPSTPWSGITT